MKGFPRPFDGVGSVEGFFRIVASVNPAPLAEFGKCPFTTCSDKPLLSFRRLITISASGAVTVLSRLTFN
ncbi:hypothetical protein Pla100_12730 [Neorhodopirellula pilleata]|uniref:Uncharacterized protein n=1 Tax=Neorhodopirellula pilleata TaxID=2714738 RepID=A0A5C6APT1_9BACT|nr:hypothetical protein Pla100_12730 [Neorhodopirellula pilleata]